MTVADGYGDYASPNGRWIAWHSVGSEITLRPTSGAPGVEFHDPTINGKLFWVDDNNHFGTIQYRRIGRIYKTRAISVRSTFRPTDVVSYEIDPRSPINRDLPNWISVNFGQTVRFEAISARRWLVAKYYFGSSSVPVVVQVSEADLANRGLPVRSYNVAFPSASEVIDMRFAPDGEHVAWVIGYPSSPMQRLMRGLHLGRWLQQRKYVVMYVSRLDGEEMNPVGTLDAVTVPDAERIRNMAWLPDCRSLSFECGDALYRVPVNY